MIKELLRFVLWSDKSRSNNTVTRASLFSRDSIYLWEKMLSVRWNTDNDFDVIFKRSAFHSNLF